MFTILTDHKPFLYAIKSKAINQSPRIIQQFNRLKTHTSQYLFAIIDLPKQIALCTTY